MEMLAGGDIDKEKIDSYYLAYMLRSESARAKITLLAQGISRYNISKNNGHYGAILLHKTSPFPDARITIALMLLEQYSKLFAESDQGDFRTIGGAKYCLSAKITFRILRITAYTIVCR